MPCAGGRIWLGVALALVTVVLGQADCPECDSDAGPCAVQVTDEDRRLGESGSVILRALRPSQAHAAPRRLAAPFTGSPPAEITLASLALPKSMDFLNEAALLEALVEEINADPSLLPNTRLRGLVVSEGTDIKSMLDGADEAHIQAKACASVGLLTGPRQSLMASVAKVRNTNHGFYMDMKLGTMPRFSEVGTTFGILGWSTIIARFLDMVTSFSPPMDRFALILPESFAPMAERFQAEQSLRGISIVHEMIYDYRRVDVDATFEDADAYAKQIIDGVVASKANLVFQCFCSTNNKYFRAQLLRHAIRAGLMRPGFQWFTHYPSVIKFKEPWLYAAEYADMWPYLDYFKVLDQGPYEPPNYEYSTSVTESQAPEWTDAVLVPKIQAHIDRYNASAPDRGYQTLSRLNCEDPEQAGFHICDPSKTPDLDAQRAKKWDAIRHMAWALHELIYVDGHYDFCDVDAAGVRTGDPQLFLDKLRSKPLVGFAGTQRFQPIGVVGGEVLTLPPSFMLTNWKPTFAKDNGLYVNTRECIIHVNRFSLETDSLESKVMRRDFFTGRSVDSIMWMGGVRDQSPLTWYHDMCGKSYRIEMSRADKKCMDCPLGEFNAPLDNVDRCESISNYSCSPGTYLVEAMASGGGLASPCMPCSPGTFSLGGNVKGCTLCPVGTFQPSEGSAVCLRCGGVANPLADLTTRYPGSMNLSDCLCPAGTYKDGNDCATCPSGMTCAVGSDVATAATFPQVDAGYMTLASQPLTVYKCMKAAMCPGGATATCGAHRTTTEVGCPNCGHGYFEGGDHICIHCDATSSNLPLAIACCLGVLIVAALVVWARAGSELWSQSALIALTTASIAFMYVQAFVTMRNLSFSWYEPVAYLMKLASVVALDVKLLRLSCISSITALGRYAVLQVLVPLMLLSSGPALLLRRFIVSRRTGKPAGLRLDRELFLDAVAVAGTLMSVFFISILMSALQPFVCFAHPGDAGSSMQGSPEVLCTWEDDHAAMVGVAVASLLAVPLPFVVLVAVATAWHRRSMTLDARKRFLRTFRFLFFRFRPHAYYYASVIGLRSVLLCLVPVCLKDRPAVQIFVVSMIFMLFSVFEAYVKPWRADVCNIFDAVMGICMVCLVQNALASDEIHDFSALKTVSFIVLGLIAAGALLSFGLAAVKLLRPAPVFDYFICHHKRDAAAQVRFLKTIMTRNNRTVFVDSDNLTNLDTLFDTVKRQVRLFVAYLTASTLSRPWCCGEVVSAVNALVAMKMVLTPSFIMPEERGLATRLPTDLGEIANYGIAASDVLQAFCHLLFKSGPGITLATGEPGCRCFERVVQELTSRQVTWSRPQSVKRGFNSVLVASGQKNLEALAVSGFLTSKLSDVRGGTEGNSDCEVCCLSDYASSLSAGTELLDSAQAVVIILSGDTLTSADETEFIAAVFRGARGICVVPVSLPCFHFPVSDLWTGDQAHLNGAFASLLKLIFVQLPVAASERVLDVQVADIARRLWGRAPPGFGAVGIMAQMSMRSKDGDRPGLFRSKSGVSNTPSGSAAVSEAVGEAVSDGREDLADGAGVWGGDGGQVVAAPSDPSLPPLPDSETSSDHFGLHLFSHVTRNII